MPTITPKPLARKVSFDDETLHSLFGAEDAENERPERLKQYFFKNKAFDSLMALLPIRILVGHKGVGKSALLKMAYLEDCDRKQFAIWVRPDDIQEIWNKKEQNLNVLIDAWKKGLVNLIFKKTVERLGRSDDEEQYGPTIYTLNALFDSVREYLQSNTIKVIDAALIAQFLKNQVLRIYIDDLDRGWEAQRSDILNLSALLNVLSGTCAGPIIDFKSGWGCDQMFIFLCARQINLPDKIERNVIWMTWSNHEILTVIAKRVATFFGRVMDETNLSMRVKSRLPRSCIQSSKAKWENAPIHRVLLSLTRRRPRDLIKLLYGGAKQAFKNDQNLIRTADLRGSFEQYSNERLQDVINEFKTEMPNIARLVHGMKPTKKERTTMENYLYTNDQLMVKLRNLMDMNDFRFTNDQSVTAKSLAEFLYKIDFITARKDDEKGRIVRLYFDQNRYLQSQFADYGFKWEVHPAYRWALQPGEPNSIFRMLDPSEE